jgi:hypothetical protein
MTTYRITHTITTDELLDANSDVVSDMTVQIEQIDDARVDAVAVETVELWDVEGTPEHAASHGEPDHELDVTAPARDCPTCAVTTPGRPCFACGRVAPAIPTVDVLSVTTNGQVVRVTIEDSTEGIQGIIGARDSGIEVMLEGDVRIYYDAEALTYDRPANANAREIVRLLTGLPVEDWRGPIVIAGRPALREETLDLIASVVPTFDFAGRW